MAMQVGNSSDGRSLLRAAFPQHRGEGAV